MADNPETTFDIVGILLITLVVGFIVYEVAQGTEAVANSAGGWGGTIAGVLVGGLAALLLF